MKMQAPTNLAVTQSILNQSKLQPDAIALRAEGVEMSYGELQRRVCQLSAFLRKRAPLAGNTVAICLERSTDWVVSALAVMHAGGAYVPLDPTWPEARIRYAIAQSGAVALVARTSMIDRLQSDLADVDPARDAAAISKEPVDAEGNTSLETLAYVIYTSGSTGTPKGVEITHANLAKLVSWHHEAFGLSAQDRASHLAGLGFDATSWEIWPALAAGATICLPGDAVLASPETVRQWMLREKVTIGFVPSVYCASMIEMDWPETTSLRFLLTGGDVLYKGPQKVLPFKVVNNYGPTECTVVATSAVLETGSSEAPPIGAPITGTTIYILDENRNRVPDGSPGELYIGGDKVGRGYRHAPEMTKDFFIDDPFASTSGGRLYRTGDRGALRPDGQIQFLGRMDRQVKIRGKRMELDEVGNVLSRHPALALATVVASEGAAKEERHLIAYVVLKSGQEITKEELATHLARQLPDFMIPSVFVRLSEMPLSASGKIDFRALPAASGSNQLQSAAKEEAATETEKQLLAIILDLLDGKPIGVMDNVFLAGGDSLLGMQLIIALKDKFGVELRFDQIFQAGTIRDLAVLVDETRGGSEAGGPSKAAATNDQRSTSGVLSMQKGGSDKPIFWVHYLNLNLNKALGEDRQVTFLILTPEDIRAMDEKPTFSSIAALFIKKILATQPEGPYTVGGFCMGAVLAYEVAVQLRKQGYEVADLLMLDGPSPSYLKTSNPLSARITDPLYVLQRFMKLGVRATLRSVRERIEKKLGLNAPKTETELGQQMIEAAATTYKAETYGGRTLLLLAARNAPHINFLPEWQSLITDDLNLTYIDSHHYELMGQPYLQHMADAISAYIDRTPKPLPSSLNSAIDLAQSTAKSSVGLASESESVGERISA